MRAVNFEQLDLCARGIDALDLPSFHCACGRIARLQGAEVVITNKVVLDADTLAACPSLKLICICATGTNNVDLPAAKAGHYRVQRERLCAGVCGAA